LGKGKGKGTGRGKGKGKGLWLCKMFNKVTLQTLRKERWGLKQCVCDLLSELRIERFARGFLGSFHRF
jgi:hypothetical protein